MRKTVNQLHQLKNSTDSNLCQVHNPVLINGNQVARELRLIMNAENISLDELLAREQSWLLMHTELVDPSRIVDQTLFGSRLDV